MLRLQEIKSFNRFNVYLISNKSLTLLFKYIQGVPGVKVTTSGFNSGAGSESKSHIHMGPIRNGSGVMSF